MKLKIKVKDFSGKTKEITKEIPAKDHLEAQQKFKSSIFKDKTKYTRKIKHKKDFEF